MLLSEMKIFSIAGTTAARSFASPQMSFIENMIVNNWADVVLPSLDLSLLAVSYSACRSKKGSC